MIRLQPRDYELLNDLGVCHLMTYSQVRTYFNDYFYCSQRVNALKNSQLIKGEYYLTSEKIFSLTKDAIKLLGSVCNVEYKMAEYKDIWHKTMRSELYLKLKKFKIKDYRIEVSVKEIGRVFDAAFEYNGRLYLVEIHNMQKTKELRDKLYDCLKIGIEFTMIIYARNKDVVVGMLQKMNKKGFSVDRRFGVKIYSEKDSVIL